MSADVELNRQGNIILVQCNSQEAKDWVNDNVNLEPFYWMGDSFPCDQHVVQNIINGMEADGLTIDGGS